MKRYIQSTCAIVPILFITLTLLGGCSSSDAEASYGNPATSEQTEETGQAAASQEVADSIVPTASIEPADSMGPADSMETEDNLIFHQKVSIRKGEKEEFRVYQGEDTQKVLMKVGEKEVELSRVSVDMGYLHMEVEEADFLGGDTKELILWLHGGSSGMCGEVQVLTMEGGNWREVPLPEALWEEDFLDVKQKGDTLQVSCSDTDFKHSIPVKNKKDICGVSYINCSRKGKEILVTYDIFYGTTNTTLGQVAQHVKYENGYVLGETVYAAWEE